MGIDIGPLERRGLPAVIESGPDKTTEPEIIGTGQAPPVFGFTGPPGGRDILIRHITTNTILLILSPASYCTAHLRTNDRLIGMIAVIIGHGILPVIKGPYRDHFIYPVEYIGHIGGIGAGAGRIEFFLFGNQGLRNPLAITIGMNPAFFIADGPDKYTGMIAVAFDQPLKLVHIFRTAVEQALLVHHQHTETVTGVQ